MDLSIFDLDLVELIPPFDSDTVMSDMPAEEPSQPLQLFQPQPPQLQSQEDIPDWFSPAQQRWLEECAERQALAHGTTMPGMAVQAMPPTAFPGPLLFNNDQRMPDVQMETQESFYLNMSLPDPDDQTTQTPGVFFPALMPGASTVPALATGEDLWAPPPPIPPPPSPLMTWEEILRLPRPAPLEQDMRKATSDVEVKVEVMPVHGPCEVNARPELLDPPSTAPSFSRLPDWYHWYDSLNQLDVASVASELVDFSHHFRDEVYWNVNKQYRLTRYFRLDPTVPAKRAKRPELVVTGPRRHYMDDEIFFNLPELIAEVAGYLDHKDQASLRAVSRRCRSGVKHLFFRTLGTRGQSEVSKGFKNRHVRTLVLDKHFACPCTSGWKYVAPIRTVSVSDTFKRHAPADCHTCPHIGDDTRLVIRPRPGGHSTNQIIKISHLQAKDVVAYVRYIPSRLNHFLELPEGDCPAPPQTPSGSFTLVFLPMSFDSRAGAPHHSQYQPYVRTDHVFLGAPFEPLTVRYTTAYAHCTITVVGAEHADPAATESYWAKRGKREERCPDLIARSLADTRAEEGDEDEPEPLRKWTLGDERLFLSRLRFVSFRDYLLSGAWRDQLDPKDVGCYLNAYDERDAREPLTPDSSETSSSAGE
jgi:hypothetical protein